MHRTVEKRQYGPNISSIIVTHHPEVSELFIFTVEILNQFPNHNSMMECLWAESSEG